MGVSIQRDLQATVLAALVLALAACGGGGEESPPPADHPDNVGRGWVTIEHPSSDYTTDFDGVVLSGKAFISKGYYKCCSGTAADTGVTVSCGGCLTVQYVRYASLGFGIPWVSEHHWAALAPLTMGTNIIVVEAWDPGNNIGYDSIRVTRVPDTTPPEVLGLSPQDGSVDVATSTRVSVNFTDEMDPSSLTSTSFLVRDEAGNPVAGTIDFDPTWDYNRNARFRPTGALEPGTTYTAHISTDIRDKGGNPLPAPRTWAFTTKGTAPAPVPPAPTPPPSPLPPPPPDTTPPAIVSVSPPEGSACGVPESDVQATFTEDVDPASLASGSFTLSDGAQPVPGNLSTLWERVSLTPVNGLAYATTYTATVTTAIRDLAGNALTENHTWSFSTVAAGTGAWRPTAEGVATPRAKHTAVWTGSEMLVWGGSVIQPSVQLLGDGFRYDPAADAWSIMSSAGAPSPRHEHVAVWTGTEMILWGGRTLDPSGWLSDGARYDPETDTWAPMSSAGAPAGAAGTVAVWTGTQMLVWNGSAGGEYDPVTDSWKPIPAFDSAPVAGFSGVWTGSQFLLWGTDTWAENVGAAYDPLANTWTSIARANVLPFWGAGRHTAVWTGTEMIVWGVPSHPHEAPSSIGAAYNPLTDTWRSVSGCGTALRSGHSAVWTGSEMIIWGGGAGSASMATGRAYNPVTDSWRELGFVNAPAGRTSHTAVWTGSEMIVWGGGDGAATQYASGARYTP